MVLYKFLALKGLNKYWLFHEFYKCIMARVSLTLDNYGNIQKSKVLLGYTSSHSKVKWILNIHEQNNNKDFTHIM